MSITAYSRYGIADACIVPLLANAILRVSISRRCSSMRLTSFSNEKPVTLRQTNRDSGAQRGKDANAGCIGNGLWMSKFQRGRAIAITRAKYPSTNTPPTTNFHHFLVPVVWLKNAVRQAKMRMRCPIPARGTIIVSTCLT